MQADILRQPDVLRQLAERLPEVAAFVSETLPPRFDGRLIAFGSGDGWFAARSLTGMGVTPASGLEVLGDVGPAPQATDCVVAISMSGNVDRTVEAAERAQQIAGRVVALTNSSGGRLADLGLPNISLQLPDVAPFLCGTSSFVMTRAMLGLLADLRRGVPQSKLAADLRALADGIEECLPRANRMAEAFAKTAAGAPGLRILSCGGPGMAMADYGAAKIVELSATPVWSDDVEEFAHRQFWTMQEGESVIYLPTGPKVAEIASASADALRNMGVRSLSIAPEAWASQADHVFTWPGDEAVDPFMLQAVVLQCVGYHWARANGFDPNRRLHLKNDTKRFKTSRMLTRRSLLKMAGDGEKAI
ncbi:SIS domain-containing protein [Jannaschia sp. 2305UL9-9]|uniref:SIS domain-containing protein n=1 Tax=Jannaschia sp. 2305UL9-9 TaxID=3121638 RepID=UPI003529B04F